jgi:cell fate regulator YaaT (PSP1 superfamily)
VGFASPASVESVESVERIQMPERQTVVAVKLRYNPKIFWFDPALSTYQTGDHVLVDTDRGREIGLVVDGALEVSKKQVKELKSPLKPVIRALDENDFNKLDELDAKGREAMPVFRELIEKHGLDMKPVSIEFLFSGDKAVFYFSNDERVDFRELVRDLAAHFHTRVDMRQIGVRDEARILGGLAHCGEELCCARLGGEFQPVSIRMAKEQDLPLNPTKISGACGRLMCCLRYEFEAYKDFKTRAPRRGALIETPIGQAKVVDFDTPREIITMRLEDGKMLSIPLNEFGCSADENGKKRPCCVSREAIDRCASSSILMALAALEQELIPSAPTEKHEEERLTRRPRRNLRQAAQGGAGTGAGVGAQEGAGSQADSQAGGGSRRSAQAGEGTGRGSRRGAGSGGSRGSARRGERDGDKIGTQGSSPGVPRTRQGRGRPAQGEESEARATGEQRSFAARERGTQNERPRPGQHSSGLRARRSGASGGASSGAGSHAASRDDTRFAGGSGRSGGRSGVGAGSGSGSGSGSGTPSGASFTNSNTNPPSDGRRRRRRRTDDPRQS